MNNKTTNKGTNMRKEQERIIEINKEIEKLFETNSSFYFGYNSLGSKIDKLIEEKVNIKIQLEKEQKRKDKEKEEIVTHITIALALSCILLCPGLLFYFFQNF